MSKAEIIGKLDKLKKLWFCFYIGAILIPILAIPVLSLGRVLLLIGSPFLLLIFNPILLGQLNDHIRQRHNEKYVKAVLQLPQVFIYLVNFGFLYGCITIVFIMLLHPTILIEWGYVASSLTAIGYVIAIPVIMIYLCLFSIGAIMVAMCAREKWKQISN